MTGWIVFWGLLAAIFAGGEAVTRSGRLWPFSAAAALAIVAAALGIAVGLQWAIYALGAALLPFVASRLLPRARD
jgi:hypothetical protein